MDTNQLESTVKDLEERVEEQFKDVSEKLRTAGDRVADLVREHPAATLAGAFAVGYLIARAARH
jgi:ElaB/YqjD/DUF883 family membrane-anchored ribosome-binding protein